MKNVALSRRSFVSALATAAVGGFLSGCSSRDDAREEQDAVEPLDETEGLETDTSVSSDKQGEPDEGTTGAGKSIVVVWSWSGNTLVMAERIASLTGAELHRLEAADPYPDDYDQTADRAKQEQDDGAYPEVANPVEGWEDYDTVYLGYPIWWYALPMIVRGFVADHDWSGKTVIPFNSHEGSGDGGIYDDLREMCRTTILDGLAIRGANVADSLGEVDSWLAGLDV